MLAFICSLDLSQPSKALCYHMSLVRCNAFIWTNAGLVIWTLVTIFRSWLFVLCYCSVRNMSCLKYSNIVIPYNNSNWSYVFVCGLWGTGKYSLLIAKTKALAYKITPLNTRLWYINWIPYCHTKAVTMGTILRTTYLVSFSLNDVF